MPDTDTILEGLNEPQREAVLTSEGPLLILAGAGSGKTRVITHRLAHLIASGRARPWEVAAVTFTNKAAGEMKERVARLLGEAAEGSRVATFHALCVRMLRRDGGRIGLPPRFQIYDTADQLGVLRRAMKDLSVDEGAFGPRSVLAQISHAKNRLLTWEVYRDQQLTPEGKVVALCYEEYQKRLRKLGGLDFDDLIMETLRLLDSNSDVAERYANGCRYLLVDEYQDTNHTQYRLGRHLAARHRNICVVGDEDQCLPSGTLVTMADGARKPIEKLAPGERVLSSYGSGDFRPAAVTEVFRKRSSGVGVAMTTAGGRRLLSTAEHVHFGGYRLGVARQTHFTYLMFKRQIGYRLGTSKVYTQGQKRPVVGYRLRALQEHADALWVLSTHGSENEARAEETVLSLRYQIPTLPFVPRKGRARHGLVHDPAYIRRVFSAFDTAASAKRLLDDFHLSPDQPHHLPQSRNSNRRNVVVTLCGDRRGRTPMHRIAISGNDAAGRRHLESLGLSVRVSKRDGSGWRFETASKDFGTVQRTVERIRTIFDINLVLNARLGRNSGDILESNSLPFVRASSLRSGMALFDDRGGYDIVENLERVSLQGDVFDLNIEGTHNFIANGIVTHNSIYSWRGADIQNILDFEKDYPDARLIRLEQNYRSTRTILGAAGAVIDRNTLRHPKKLWTENEAGPPVHYHRARDDRDEAESVVRIVASLSESFSTGEIAILYRTNYQSRLIEEALVRTGIRYRIVGSLRFYERKEIKDLLAYLRLMIAPDDDPSFLRAVNTPPRGIGSTTIDHIAALAAERGLSLHGAALAALSEGRLPPRAAASLSRFLEMMEELRAIWRSGGASMARTEGGPVEGLQPANLPAESSPEGEPKARASAENATENTSTKSARPGTESVQPERLTREDATAASVLGSSQAGAIETEETGTAPESGEETYTAEGFGPVVPIVTRLIDEIGFLEHLQKAHPGDHEDRAENVEALVSAAAEFDEQDPGGGLQAFLDRSSLRSDTDDVQGDTGVTLLTVHSAKGLEFSAVVLSGLEENLFPHSRSIDTKEDLEEERRLCYVAFTRAKKRLILTNAFMRRSFGDFVENPPSRFLDEIPKELLVCSESSPYVGVTVDPLRSGAAAGRQPSRFGGSTFGTGGFTSGTVGATSRAGASISGFGASRAGGSRSTSSGSTLSSSRSRGSRSSRGVAGFPRAVGYAAGDDYAVGRIVTHPMFGPGTILHKEGSGDSLKLTIRFREGGTKKILPRHTTLVVHD